VVIALLSQPAHARLVSEIQATTNDATARRVAHWLASVVSESDLGNYLSELKSEPFIELSKMVETAELNSTAAKEIFIELLAGKESPRSIAEEKNLLQVSDESAILDIIEKVLADPASQQAVSDVKAGQDKAIGFLVGQVMKQSKGKANPALVQKLIRKQLGI
jgi:aspartyl-tRNA(Asn)/glutamyl-tRNA(Gln) amidotransferase subunit B